MALILSTTGTLIHKLLHGKLDLLVFELVLFPPSLVMSIYHTREEQLSSL
jgi:hypothetical protein